MPVAGLPLGLGSSGEPVADLRRRLAALGFSTAGDEGGEYGAATHAAVAAFQEARGLRVDGICGDQTWATVVEAGYRLGDRRLYQRKPMTRGDDVADLQQRLGALGFDAGKVDGIFGPDTAGALADFQRNAGLTVDGIFGPDELQVLERLGQRGDAGGRGGRSDGGRQVGSGEEQIAELRELASLRWSIRTLEGLRVAIGERGGLDGLTTALGRHLRRRGADPIVLHHPNGADLAQQANLAGADLFLELASLGETRGCRCAFYKGYRFCSPAGQSLAESLAVDLAAVLDVPALGTSGMAIPVLRETRMPAVVCEAGPTATLVEHAPVVVAAVTASIERWVGAPLS